MKANRTAQNKGFSLVELLIAMTIMLVVMGTVSTLVSRAMAVRSRESRKSDALTSAEAALNVISRELGNSGYGIYTDPTSGAGSNGIIVADSSANRIHFRSNITNTGGTSTSPGATALSTNQPGEDVTYYFDSATNSIVRYDPNATPRTSVVVNRISNVTFEYFDYSGSSSTPTGPNSVPSANTARVRITVQVVMDPIAGQPDDTVVFRSDVTLRNANFMLRQY